MALSHIRVVLVRPLAAGNVGSVARAIANMGLGPLVLVSPGPDTTGTAALLSSKDARGMAAGGLAVLEGARVAPTLSEALADCVLAAGFTARRRGWIEPPLASLPEAAGRILEAAQSGPTALVFGPEDHGLSNAELGPCAMHVRIPAARGYTVLNLAAAVVVAGYELARCHQTSGRRRPPDRPAPANVHEVEILKEGARRLLDEVGFWEGRQEPGMATLGGIVARVGLQRREHDFLMGALHRVEQAIARRPQPPDPRTRLKAWILDLPGVVERPSQFGAMDAFWLGRRELAHMQAADVIDVRVTRRVIGQYRDDPRARPHRPGSVWLEFRFATEPDVEDAFLLVKAGYEVHLPEHLESLGAGPGRRATAGRRR